MTKEEAKVKIKAAAYQVAAERGINEALELLRQALYELEGTLWNK